MAKIEQKISTLPDVKDRRDAEFISSADAFLDVLPKFSDELDVYSAEANNLRDEVNGFRNAAKTYRDEAYNKAEEAKAVVIPEEATYSEDEINLRSVVIGETEFKALQDRRRQEYAGSGFVEWGGHICNWKSDQQCINDGLWTGVNVHPNIIYIGEEQYSSLPPTEININGISVKPKMYPNKYNVNEIKLPDPTTSLFTIKDSTSLNGDMKQGDFAILKDLDRELVTNGTFDDGIDGWNNASTDKGSISYDSTNKRLKVTNDGDEGYPYAYQKLQGLVKGVKYKFSGSIDIGDATKAVAKIRNDLAVYTTTETTNFELEFISDGDDWIELYLYEGGNTGHSCYFDNISIKQVKEQPIVSLQNTAQGIDVYANSSLFEARDSISRQDLVFLEVWEENIADKDIVYPFGKKLIA